MSPEETNQIIKLLIEKKIRFDVGLTGEEVLKTELKFNIKFPTDLKLFLQTALPVSKGFVNWREGLISDKKTADIIDRLEWPLNGLLFDLKENNFWIKEWGDKPNTYEEQEIIARKKYLLFPKLIPIYFDRFIPSEPIESGNPVFSVHQMDIIYYGNDLPTYFSEEFHFELPDKFQIPERPKNIKFWSWWVEEGWMED